MTSSESVCGGGGQDSGKSDRNLGEEFLVMSNDDFGLKILQR